MRFRYTGESAQLMTVANVLAVHVEPGDVFEIADKWAYALAKRGTPCEPVDGDETATSTPAKRAVPVQVEEPEIEAQDDSVLMFADAEVELDTHGDPARPSFTRGRSNRRR